MKVLLLGDMSGYHQNLAIGLRANGINVDLASSGDNFKGFSRDIEFSLATGRLHNLKQLFVWLASYDVIQFIKVDCLDVLSILGLFVRSKFNIKSRLFVAAVGCDYQFWTKGRRLLQIPLFDEIEKYDVSGHQNRKRDWVKNKLMLNIVDGVIGCFDYYEAYKNEKKCLAPIFHPVDVVATHFKAIDLQSQEKLLIFHGVQKGREGFKGTHHITQAFDVLNKRYPNDLECIAKGGMPYHEYKKHIEKFHVLIDQTNCISYGMNALLGLAQGKIVGCGLEGYDTFWKNWQELLGIEKRPPTIKMYPDKDVIVKNISALLEQRDDLHSMSLEGRAYVEKYHDCRKVAKMYLQRWGIADTLGDDT